MAANSLQNFSSDSHDLAILFPLFFSFIALLIIWSIFWKGLALWHAARHGQGWWFGVLLILNTAGILEIIYLFAVLKLKFSQLFSK